MKPEIVIRAEQIKTKLRDSLENDQRSFRWFYFQFIIKRCGITYSAFMGMLNGYGNIKDSVEDEINKYLSKQAP